MMSIASKHRCLQWAVMALCCAITFLRAPRLLLDAQFWGEDGWFWWPEARELGLSSLWLPHTGYFQTDDRLIGLLAVWFPLAWGPFIFAFAAYVFELLPVAFLVSERGRSLCPSVGLRCLVGIMWCVLPNVYEVWGNLTNSQWHLAVLSILVVLSAPPRSRMGWIFDGGMLALGALSGPFSLLMLPIVALQTWKSPARANFVKLGIIAVGALCQGLALHATQRGVPPNLGASVSAFVRIIAAQVMLAPMIGHLHLPGVYALRLWKNGLLPWSMFLAGAILCVDAMRRWHVMRMAGLFVMLLLAASLSHPVSSPDGRGVWEWMLLPDFDVRYLYLPLLFWMTVVTVEACAAPWGWVRGLGGLFLLLTIFIGVPKDWRIPVEGDRDFYRIAHEFDRASAGTVFVIPVRPGTQATYTK